MKNKLMAHLYFGDPNDGFSLKLAKTLLEGGADILEVGIPYSDPVCDGEVFQRACKRALEARVTPPKVLEGIKKIRKMGFAQPIYATSYFGPIFKMGVEKFLAKVKEIGAQGVIIPDILTEEQDELLKFGVKNGIEVIQFATPYSSVERIKKIVSVAEKYHSGFIYCVSVPGVTGVRNKLPDEIGDLVKRVKKLTKIPVFVGFGVSKPEHARQVLESGGDGVIVGSAIGKIYEGNLKNPEKTLPEVTKFAVSLKKAMMEK